MNTALIAQFEIILYGKITTNAIFGFIQQGLPTFP